MLVARRRRSQRPAKVSKGFCCQGRKAPPTAVGDPWQQNPFETRDGHCDRRLSL